MPKCLKCDNTETFFETGFATVAVSYDEAGNVVSYDEAEFSDPVSVECVECGSTDVDRLA